MDSLYGDYGVVGELVEPKHDHIKQNMEKLKGKVVLDCFNIVEGLGKVYHI